MTETNATSEYCCTCQSWQNEIVECGDPVEIARKVKLAFKKMPGEMALACFAKVMTAELPHPIKVAVWDAVRYSHIWWGVDEVLKGSVMEDPIVQQAFADAVPMRRWMIANQRPGSYILDTATEPAEWEHRPIYHTCCYTNAQQLVGVIVKGEDSEVADYIHTKKGILNKGLLDYTVADFVDYRGNSILWYLTYRDDQQAEGGFACPRIERELLQLGADPNRRNNLGLCWNDVRRHLIRPEM